jgi:type VI secretion system secreted protein Hcp
MSFDAFVKLGCIENESTDSKHSGWIEVIQFNTGLSQMVSTTASSAGGAGAERADVRPFNFFKASRQ